MRSCGLKREIQRVTRVEGPEAAMAAGTCSQESENWGGESKNSRSTVNRIGLEQVQLTLVGQLRMVGYGSALYGLGLSLGASYDSQG